MKIRFAALTALAALSVGTACGAQLLPKDTEVWTPEPPVVAPGAQAGAAPSDALVLFEQIAADNEAPQNNRQRATVMAELIKGQGAAS